NIAFCMSCHKGGGPVNFWRQLKNISIEKTIEELCQKFNLNLPQQHTRLPNNVLLSVLKTTQEYFQTALKYIIENIKGHYLENYLFHKRKLNLTLIKKFGLGYAHNHAHALKDYLLQKGFALKDLITLGLVQEQKNQKEYLDFFQDRIMFPLTDEIGNIIGFTGRIIQEQRKSNVKYLFNKENILFKKNNLLYNLCESKEVIRQKKEIILCEGIFDVMAFHKINITNVVATLGTQLSLLQIQLLKKYTKKIIIAYDGDRAGREAAQKISQLLNKNNFQIRILFLKDSLDPDVYIQDRCEKMKFNYSTLIEKTQDYLFYMIEESKRQNHNNKEIEQQIFKLMKHYDLENQKYYQQEIYKKYHIFISLENNHIQKCTNLNNTDHLRIMKQKYAYDSVQFVQRKNFTERDLLTEIFLSQEYLKFIKDDIYDYVLTNVNIIDLLNKVEEYYDQHAEEEEIQNGVDIDKFTTIYDIFLTKLSYQFDVYRLLLDIKNNILFKNKIRIQSQVDLNKFYFCLQKNLIIQKKEELEELKKTLQKLQDDVLNEEDQRNYQELIAKIKIKQKELLKLKSAGDDHELYKIN
ncbi:toprim domain-containing protein, partial [Candidatus Phytoplasma melaleucae]